MPKVSVIIPNYNHALYLPQRIESVLNQTFTDFEVLILDDCSPDDSVNVIEKFAEKDARITVYLNEQNSGSTFAQWNKGVELAKGEYIWIAESDDYCEPTLLQTLVNKLDKNEKLGIAFAQSAIVDENGKLINSFNENYKYIFKCDRWEHDFEIEGEKEVANYLIFSNTIPNASGALMRKSVYIKAGGAETTWRLNGDWFFYVKMLLISDLAYVSDHLNYFRMHQNTQRHKANEDYVVYDEIIATITFITQQVKVDPDKLQQAYKNVSSWWGSSLFRQKLNLSYLKNNWRLYRYFKTKRKHLALSILSNMLFAVSVGFLSWLGVKPALKKMRLKLFPGKYFEY